MGNIVGEKFENYVLNQIDVRQKLYGSGFSKSSVRSPIQQQLLNNKNAWLKLASSVAVVGDNTPAIFDKATGKYADLTPSTGEKRLRDIGIDNTNSFVGSGLAEQTVLFNTLSTVNPTEFDDKGRVDSSGSYAFRSGVNKSNSLWNSRNSYGLGGNDQGIVPAPGLISFSLESQNRGSIRKGTLELKCYNKFQFELIELMYLRLGFTVMVEWGWDKYTTNGKDISDVGNTIIEDSWFQNNTNVTQLEMANTIERYRKLYHGNYDGFYGRVTNFEWSFGPDGNYDISIDIISVGDVIESLKVATKSTVMSVKEIQATVSSSFFPEGLEESPIVTNAGSTALSQDLFTDICGQEWDLKNGEFLNTSVIFKPPKIKDESGNVANTDKYSYYMTFGALIQKLQTYCVPQLLNDFGTASEMIKFDSNPDKNLCAVFPNQLSLDPRICIVKPAIAVSTVPSDSSTYINFHGSWDMLKDFSIAEDVGNTSVIYGKIMNIYLNYDFITGILAKATDVKDKKSRLSIFRFLTDVCDGINTALGNVNNLEVALKNDNIITIIEQNAIPGIESLGFQAGKMSVFPSFEIFGINPEKNIGSFVTDFKFNTKITPELASMISIGATAAETTTKDYDATAFSKWNEGLYDRYNKEFRDPAEDAILKAKLALADQANALGITSYRDITSEQATILYNSWNEGEEDRGDDEVAADLAIGLLDIGANIVEGGQRAWDWAAEGATDIWNSGANLFRDDDKQKSTFGVDNIDNTVNPDLSEKYDYLYSENFVGKACGVELQGYRIAKVNSVFPQEGKDVNGGLNWEEYVEMVADYLHAEKMKRITGQLTPEELSKKYGKNYIFYLTRILGGDFAAGTNDSPAGTKKKDKVGYTPKDKYTYFQYNSAIIKEGKIAFEAYVTSTNNMIFQKTGNPSGTIGFLPIDMGMTFEGMSGIKIYNMINIRQGFLPKQYPETYKFLISTVNHSIENNSWSSDISTITIPKTYPTGKYNFDDLTSATDSYVRSSGGEGGRPENQAPTPEADRVREYLKTTGGRFEEKLSGGDGLGGFTSGVVDGVDKGELSSGGDISKDGADMTIAVLRAIRSAEPNIRLTLTAGNDLYHHNKPKSYTSRHEVGNAIDFTINNPSAENLDAIKKILNGFLVGPKNWYYLDEYGEPTKVANGAHFHLSLPSPERKIAGTQKNNEIFEAEAQLKAGQISKLP